MVARIPTTGRDPRSLITPDALEVSPALLGLPLATPWQRLAAILVDLAVIGLITLTTRSFGLILGVLVAVLFIREGFKRTPVRGSVFGRAMRLSVGCLGLWIGIITIVIWTAVGATGRRDRADSDDRQARDPLVAEAEAPVEATLRVFDLLAGVAEARRFAEASTPEEAVRAGAAVAQIAMSSKLNTEEVRDLLNGLVPDDAPWSAERDAIIEDALFQAHPDTAQAERLLAQAEAPPISEAFADSAVADSLLHLSRRIASLQESSDARQRAIRELRDQLEGEGSGGSIFSWFRNFIDELGFGFGWASLYLTVILSWWKGQTVGKRLMKIRVLRLDGDPITWWTAFERAGGYAAGFATGLLGFAQVFWDANRQAIHDRIVGTVVVVDGAAKIADWEKAL